MNAATSHYFSFLLNILIPKDKLKPLLLDLSDQRLERLYDRLKDMPCPRQIYCSTGTGSNYRSHVYFFVDEIVQSLERDIYYTIHTFNIPARAFSQTRLSDFVPVETLKSQL
ncbi:MAG: hypothetical protein NTX47_03120 [Candidatus Omnitrophica bacterium]|nr:hypothetical protein [Candidatus Omnitrophota bacterium]